MWQTLNHDQISFEVWFAYTMTTSSTYDDKDLKTRARLLIIDKASLDNIETSLLNKD